MATPDVSTPIRAAIYVRVSPVNRAVNPNSATCASTSRLAALKPSSMSTPGSPAPNRTARRLIGSWTTRVSGASTASWCGGSIGSPGPRSIYFSLSKSSAASASSLLAIRRTSTPRRLLDRRSSRSCRPSHSLSAISFGREYAQGYVMRAPRARSLGGPALR
jgi:hypothetical protein